MEEKKTKSFLIRLTEKQFNEIGELSEKKRRSKSQMVRLIIEDYLDKVNL